MKASPHTLVLAAAVLPALLLPCGGCSRTDDTSRKVQEARADAERALTEAKAAVADSWDAIKDFTYERRADFSAGIERLAKGLDDKAAALRARTSAAPDASEGPRREALRQYDRARAELKARLAELAGASSETWADAKARAFAAWKRLQAAGDRLAKAGANP